jgi:phenylacetate-CoA ligase
MQMAPENHAFDQFSSCWDPATPRTWPELREWQLRRAWQLAERLAASNPFYKARLGALPAERSAEAFGRLPVTTKSELVEDCSAHPPYGIRTTAAPETIRHVVETSGTSGAGREVFALDASDEEHVFRGEATGFYWVGVRAGTRVVMTLPIGVTAAGQWYYGGLRLLGANVFAIGPYPTERKVTLLRRYGADLIVGTPTYVQRLALACEAEGVEPASLGVKALMVAGESYNVAWATAIQERWGATLYEQYGCTERAFAWTCPGGVVRDGALGTLHFPAELAYCEIIDPATGQASESGGRGELITTPLVANASPLLRFATRDRVELVAAGDCPCGRPLPGIRAGGVQRYDDMIKIRGVNVWPASLDSAIFGVNGVLNYQGTVRRDVYGNELTEVVLECEPERSEDVSRSVMEAVRRIVGLGVKVSTVSPGDITRAVPEGFVKLKRWRDLRSTSRADPGPGQTTMPRAHNKE